MVACRFLVNITKVQEHLHKIPTDSSILAILMFLKIAALSLVGQSGVFIRLIIYNQLSNFLL